MHSFVLPVYLCVISFCVVACQDCEVLETETKRFEDLEFQQLERESRQDEEKETHSQQLLREIADYQRSTVTRKVTLCVCVFYKSNPGKMYKDNIIMPYFEFKPIKQNNSIYKFTFAWPKRYWLTEKLTLCFTSHRFMFKMG